MRAIVVGPERRLVLREVAPPRPQRDEAVVRVAAISLNRGEIRRAAAAREGWRPGWDVAGTIETAAVDGSGPAAGTRVVGLLPSAAWAESVAVPVRSLATLPDPVSLEEAATLPVAGLTALHALAKRGDLLERDVLVTGASGGVGHFACRLAKLAGARVVGVARSQAHAERIQGYGAEAVVVGDDPAAAAKRGPFDLVLESIGGASLAAALDMLKPGGLCVSFGVTGAVEAKIDLSRFYLAGGKTLYGFALFHEVAAGEPAGIGLSRLVSLVAARKLVPDIALRRPWSEIATVAADLADRRYPGKAVLIVG